ncbi:MAG: hypothetical protein ACQESD_00340 [Thermoplasmatota archaeon]
MFGKKNSYEKLEGTYQIVRLKKLEKMATIPQAIGIVAAFIIFLFLQGAQLNPFFLPLYFPLLVAFILLLILAIEFFAFRLLEIRYTKSESAKFLMADRSSKKAYTIIILAIIFLGITATPFVPQQIEKYTAREGEVEVRGDELVNFPSRGRFDFVHPDTITVELISPEGDANLSDITVDIYILSEEDYEAGNYDLKVNRGVYDPKEATSDAPFEYEMPRLSFQEYNIFMQSEHDVRVKYQIEKDIPQEQVYPFSLISLAFIISYSIWIYVLYPIKKKHSEKAIYK